jgi:3-oxoacyl-[acyl-carrier protein] reductase
MLIDMSGKVVLVTGASQGLGETIAFEFAKSHADVVVNYVEHCTKDPEGGNEVRELVARAYEPQREKAENLVGRIKALGQKAIAIECDVSKSNEVRQMVKQIVDQFGRIDVLVNNAAVNPKRPEGKTPIYKITDEEWDLVIDVNLKGVFNCTREVLAIMLKQKSGSIVNIASSSAHTGNGAPVGAPYCISKAGIICLSKAAALDLASMGIRVNSVAPGPIAGPNNLRNPPEVNAAMAQAIPLKRIAKPEEIAYAAIFLASEYSGFTTGETLNVNGGSYLA